MHYQRLGALAFLLTSFAAAIPAPVTDNDFITEPKCLNTDKSSPNTAAFENSDIEAAINAIKNNKLAKSRGSEHPHRNTPGKGSTAKDSWADYNLPGCAQESSDDTTKVGFVEFPILRSKEVYKGGKGGPDRVLFQFVTDDDSKKTYDTPGFKNLVGNFKSTAYCDTANHVLNDAGEYISGFQPCHSSKGTFITSSALTADAEKCR